jgi:DSF synthase
MLRDGSRYFDQNTGLGPNRSKLNLNDPEALEAAVGHQEWLNGFEQLSLKLDPVNRTFWCKFAPSGRACFNIDLLVDLRRMQKAIADPSSDSAGPAAGRDFEFMVVGSATPGIYNLGGDLMLFRQLVNERDAEGLRSYARLCVDVVCANETAYNAPITTIAAVQGSCLGGGFAAALSCDVIFAEEHVKFGFPEILFGLFPGMGAINFLARRVSRRNALDLILSGKTYSAEALLELGLVDHIVATGEGETAAQSFIEKNLKRSRAHAAVHSSLRGCQHYDEVEYDEIIERWVSVAMQLAERDLNKMMKLSAAQERKRQPSAAGQMKQ